MSEIKPVIIKTAQERFQAYMKAKGIPISSSLVHINKMSQFEEQERKEIRAALEALQAENENLKQYNKALCINHDAFVLQSKEQAKRIEELESWANSLFDTRTKNVREIEILRKYCNDQAEANALQMKMLEHQNKSLLDQLVKADLLAPRTYVIELPEGATLLGSASKNGE